MYFRSFRLQNETYSSTSSDKIELYHEDCISVYENQTFYYIIANLWYQPFFISWYIYTSSVFCYDKHKKNFDIHFSMKRHEPVQRRIMTPVE